MSEIDQSHIHEVSKDDPNIAETIQERTAPTNLSHLDSKQNRIRQNIEEFEQLFGVDEDAYDQPTTTRKELWSYYLYYNGQCCMRQNFYHRHCL